jgi:hypothetical protein
MGQIRQNKIKEPAPSGRQGLLRRKIKNQTTPNNHW